MQHLHTHAHAFADSPLRMLVENQAFLEDVIEHSTNDFLHIFGKVERF